MVDFWFQRAPLLIEGLGGLNRRYELGFLLDGGRRGGKKAMGHGGTWVWVDGFGLRERGEPWLRDG